MAWQLIFTSAPLGLNPGSSGYCTVARSQGMREAVASRLEQWSVYTRPARGPGPVVCAHRVLDLRGTTFYVLTRIVDSGLDYTGRTNFIAHHLVVQRHELEGAPLPADVFLNAQIWYSEWSAEPQWLEDVFLQGLSPVSGLPARHWEQAAGDAGAAALAVNETGTAAQPTDLVTIPGREETLLSLYGESLCLLDADPATAWNTPFTTYLQPENDPADFRWRGLWAGNRQNLGGRRIDFAGGVLPPVPENAFAERARTGRRPQSYASKQPVETVAAEEEPVLPGAYKAPTWKKATPRNETTPPPKTGRFSGWSPTQIYLVSGLALVLLVLSTVLIVRLTSRPEVIKPFADIYPSARTPGPEPTQAAETDQSIANTTPQPSATPIPQPSVASLLSAVQTVPNAAYKALYPGETIYVAVSNDPQSLGTGLPEGNPLQKMIDSKQESKFLVTLVGNGHETNPTKCRLVIDEATHSAVIDDDSIGKLGYSFDRLAVKSRDVAPIKFISFAPRSNIATDTSLQTFHLLILRDASVGRKFVVELPRNLLISDGARLIVKNKDAFQDILSHWLDASGKPINFKLRCGYQNLKDPLDSGSAVEINFDKAREDLINNLHNGTNPLKLEPVAVAPPPPPQSSSPPTSIEDDLANHLRDYTDKKIQLHYHKSNGVFGTVPSWSPPLSGKSYYEFLRHNLVNQLCMGMANRLGEKEKSMADTIMPLDVKPTERLINILNVPMRVQELIKRSGSVQDHDFKNSALGFSVAWDEVFNEKALAAYKGLLETDVIALPSHLVRPPATTPNPVASVLKPDFVAEINNLCPANALDNRIYIEAEIGKIPFTLIEFEQRVP